MTSPTLLYLDAAAVRALAIPPASARAAVAAALRDHARGLSQALPKSALPLAPGRAVQAMVAASAPDGLAVLKWVATNPPGTGAPAVAATLCVNDHGTGRPLAILDGAEATLLRTAALSAVAAGLLLASPPRTLGLVGCGLQATAHLDALLDLFPSLTRVLALGRTPAPVERLLSRARRAGLDARASPADALLSASDLVVSTVPAAPGLVPFLDARLLRPDALACAVDLGRSWLPGTLPAFDTLLTDSLSQGAHPWDAAGRPVESVRFSTDLVALCGGAPAPRAGRRLFCFRGHALADLALARLVLEAARAQGAGVTLPL